MRLRLGVQPRSENPMYLCCTVAKGDAKHLSVMCIVLLQVHVVRSSDQFSTVTCMSWNVSYVLYFV